MNKENINYHFLPAKLSIYENSNFNELLKEYNENDKTIYWVISNNNGVHKIRKNDICLIYYSDLPDECNRILLIGTVISSDYESKDKEKSIYPYPEQGKQYIRMKVKCINLKGEHINDFSLYNLRKKYKIINEKGHVSYRKIILSINEHKQLIEDINKAYKQGTYQLKTVVDYYDNYCSCEFNGHDSNRKNHTTFTNQNGFKYIERHHLVTRSLIKKHINDIPNIDAIINSENNLFKLCPNCHMEIHHGTIKRRKEKIEFLYLKNKQFFDNNFNTLKKKKTTLEWLYDIYN